MFKELLCFGALLALTQATALRVQARDGTRNVYYGYSRSKRTYGAQLTDAASITAAFDLAEPIIVIVHGQGGLIHDMLKTNILESTLSNVVVVDWTGYSNRGYHQAATAVPSIGYDGLADFLSLVVTAGWALHDIHLIGFDLGAHVCGFAGRERGGGIGKITGLNPARQDWGPGSGHLSKGDALYVEVIHTEIRTYGIGIPIGDIDYFINNGITQPGCTNTLCSHNRAYEIMAASVSNDIKGNMCNDLSEMQRNVCRSHERTVGTLEIWRRGTGIYRANTSNRFPYGQ